MYEFILILDDMIDVYGILEETMANKVSISKGNGKNGKDHTRRAKEKLKHSLGDATSFFNFFFLFMAGRIFLGILGLAIGTLLLIIGSWSSSARIGVSGITQEPWPGKQIEDQD